jgi:hypothetical protein
MSASLRCLPGARAGSLEPGVATLAAARGLRDPCTLRHARAALVRGPHAGAVLHTICFCALNVLAHGSMI